MKFRFCMQDPTCPETTYLYEAIIGAFVDAVSWRGIYAFATLDSVDHLMEDSVVKEFMARGGEARILVGIDAITNKPTLERLVELERQNEYFRPRVFRNETGRLFHPKISDFAYADGRRTLIVGSGNLTPGGLTNNFENYAVVEGERGEEVDVSQLDEFLERHADDIRPIDIEAMEIAKRNLFRSVGGARRRVGRSVQKPRRRETAVSECALETEPADVLDRILIAKVPKAGLRWPQAHFNRRVVQEYFRISDYDTQRVYLTHVGRDGTRADVEVRPCVYSRRNKNHRIEIAAARGREYPDTPPLLLFRGRGLRIFDYMLLFPGERGYESLYNLAGRLPPAGRGFRRVVTDIENLEDAWADCPILRSDKEGKLEI